MTDFPQKVAEIIELLHSISERTDTAYVLVTATALEEVLEMALLAIMRDLSNTTYSDLFKGYGPLSSFAAKIDIAYALKIIDEDLVGDFRAIKAIRNAFAHPKDVVHFNSSKLTKEFQKLKGWTKSTNARQLFDARMAACIEHLNRHNEATIFVNALKADIARRPSPDKSN